MFTTSRHADDLRAPYWSPSARDVRDYPSLAADPPPEHPSGVVVGKRRRFLIADAEAILRADR